MDDTQKTENPVHIEHFCEHPGCVVWGGFGFSRPPKAAPRWYCYDHRPMELVTPTGRL